MPFRMLQYLELIELAKAWVSLPVENELFRFCVSILLKPKYSIKFSIS